MAFPRGGGDDVEACERVLKRMHGGLWNRGSRSGVSGERRNDAWQDCMDLNSCDASGAPWVRR